MPYINAGIFLLKTIIIILIIIIINVIIIIIIIIITELKSFYTYNFSTVL